MSSYLGDPPGCYNENKFNLYCCDTPVLDVEVPDVSYLYTRSGNNYRFSDPHVGRFSFLPAMEVLDKTVTCTMHHFSRAVYYDNTFFLSLPDFCKKIKPLTSLDQELLDKIAIIANYLAQGTTYTYIAETAKVDEPKLDFLVKNALTRCKVTLPSFRDNEMIDYEDIDSWQEV